MKTTNLKLSVAIALILLFAVPSCWAAEKGYCFVVSSSMREKVVFFTSVFSARVSGAIYSQEEFVADVELIRDIENQFQQYLKKRGLNTMDYLTEARVGYRSQAIAENRLATEKSEFEGRGYTIKKTGGFTYAD
jgi:hypothetical protein